MGNSLARQICYWIVIAVAYSFSSVASTQETENLATLNQASFAKLFRGRDSCALNTCHGGPVGESVDWNSSLTVFEAADPHAKAGVVLSSQLTKEMIWALDPRAKSDKRIYKRILVERCATCHAPGLASLDLNQVDDGESQRMHFVDGVSCESCHGPAGDWLEPHKLSDFTSDVGIKLGLRETANFVDRSTGCVRCHVGSRDDDGMVRDMNHDMIAAGHPALRFDAWTFSERLPPHWKGDLKSRDGLPSGDGHDNLRRYRAGKLVSLRAAAKLTQQRIRDITKRDSTAVWPEFADFDCFACHQSLRYSNSGTGNVSKSGRRIGYPRYNPILETGASGLWIESRYSQAGLERYDSILKDLSLRSADTSDLGNVTRSAVRLEGLVNELLKFEVAKDNAPVASSFVAKDGAGQAMFAYEAKSRDLDWHDANVWFLQIQAAALDRKQLDDPRVATRLRQLYERLRFDRTRPTEAGASVESPTDFDINKFQKLADELAASLQPSN